VGFKKVVKEHETEASKTPEVNIAQVIDEYTNLSEQAKVIASRKEELATIIKEYAKKHGTKDDKGSYYSEQGDFVYGATAKKTVKLNAEKAEKFFRERKLWKKVTDTIEIINEDKVEGLINAGTMTVDELETITDISTSFSVLVKKKETPEEMPEVQVVKTENSPRKVAPFRTRGRR